METPVKTTPARKTAKKATAKKAAPKAKHPMDALLEAVKAAREAGITISGTASMLEDDVTNERNL